MIQRIQTLFLTIGLVLMVVLLFMPLGEIAVGDKIFLLKMPGIIDSSNGQTAINGWYLFSLLGIIMVVQTMNIFFFKMRPLQMKLAFCNIILSLGFTLMTWLFIKNSLANLGNGIYHFKIAFTFPLIIVLFNYLAYRAIKKDEELVKSVDRIR